MTAARTRTRERRRTRVDGDRIVTRHERERVMYTESGRPFFQEYTSEEWDEPHVLEGSAPLQLPAPAVSKK